MATESEMRPMSDLAVPPGEILAEELEVRSMSQQELAIRTGRPSQVINEIVRGKKTITHDTALEFEKVLGIPAHIWINLEANYQLTRARQRDHLELEKQEDWLTEFPIRELIRRELIPDPASKPDAVRALLQFLGVASFPAWRQTLQAVSFRITPGSKVSEASLACWLRQGEIMGQDLVTDSYDESKFRSALTRIRELTTEAPDTFEPEMKRLCAESGVAFVIVPEMSKSGANGAARWLGREKALIQLSLRYKWCDHFWFSFFHESCHVLFHQLKEIHVDGINGGANNEDEANAFAAGTLIPGQEWTLFVDTGAFDRMSILTFARKLELSPGIIVGRLQHERLIDFSAHNALRTRFQWVGD